MNICLFSSYSENNKIDNYVKFYLEILKKHFDEVVFITNKRNIDNSDTSFINEIGISFKLVNNEGYDFGMWYKALEDINTDDYEQIAFVNDSMILFNDLEKVMSFVNNSHYDFCAITDSNQISHHLQSYFTVAKGRKCINTICDYYKSNGIIITDDVRNIINIYEIGMSSFLKENGLKIGSMFKYNDYPRSINISLMNANDIIQNGCPMIKKKLIFKTFRNHESSFLIQHGFNMNFDYITQIKKIIYPFNININYILDI